MAEQDATATRLGLKIGFIGAGEMATALACGLIRRGLVVSDDLLLRDVCAPAAVASAERCGGRILASSAEVIEAADIVVFSVKPPQIEEVLSELSHHPDGKQRLFLTIVAGVRLETYTKFLGASARVARVMPNTPALVGMGASAYCFSSVCTEKDRRVVHAILETIGLAIAVPETQLDAVTGLSGSGPAYAFLIIDALASGGVKMGLPRSMALRLAAQTLKGAAEMVLATGEHPAVLQDRVTSPAGTTIAGTTVLETMGVRGALITAVTEATRRSQELGCRDREEQ